MPKKLTYKSAGVDIEKAEKFARYLGKTISSKVFFKQLPSFSSLFPLKDIIRKVKNPVLVSSCDGVGTKLKIAQLLDIHNTVGEDLVAMNVNDILCVGAKPLFFLDYFATGRLNLKIAYQVIRGIEKGVKRAGCFLLGGETAEMPGMYDKDEYDLAGFCVGIVEASKMVNGMSIKKGDVVLGIASSGLHSNGFSLVRKVFSLKEIKMYGKELLKPTRIYVKPILSLLNTQFCLKIRPIKGIAHITGGAFYNKATKILPSGLGMVVKRNSWKVPRIFRIIQEKGKIEDKEMYSVFNMGIGMILVVDKRYCKKIIDFLEKFVKVYLIGEIDRIKNKIEFI